MIKHYISDSDISINVFLGGGANTRVSFTPLSGGGSVFCTSDEELQHALEKHYRFGSLFTISHTEDTFIETPADVEGGAIVEESMKVIKVSDFGAAKDYLSETFGVSRTRLKTQKSIIETAQSYGVVFEGLE